MYNPYAQVFRSYLRRPFSSWVAAVWSITGVIQLVTVLAVVLALHTRPTAAAFVRGGLMPLVLALAIAVCGIWFHLRQLMIDPRRALAPDFARPNLVVFGGLSFLLVIAAPAAVIFRIGSGSVGLLAITTVVLAVAGWGAVTLSPVLYIAGIILWVWGTLAGQDEFIANFITGRHEPLAIAVFAAACGASALALVRMCSINEEDPLYQRLPWNQALSPRSQIISSSGGQFTSPWQRLVSRLQRRPTVLIPAGGTRWARASAWQALLGGGTYIIALMGTILLLIEWGLWSYQKMHLSMVFIWLALMPAMMICQQWLQQWRYLEADSLRPIQREKFIAEIALAITLNFARAWCLLAAFAVAEAVLWAPAPIHPAQIAANLTIALGVQIFAFALQLWLMRYRSPAKLMLPMIPLLGLAGAAIGLLSGPMLADYRAQFLLGAVLLGGVGLLLARDGYRRWLVTELG